jgi:fused signal recognition particle receptor
MPFWRAKTNPARAEEQTRDDRLIHHANDPALEPPPTETEPGIDPELAHALNPTESEILDDMSAPLPPDNDPLTAGPFDARPLFPSLTIGDQRRTEEPEDDTASGGWLSRLTQGLTKSTTKLSQGLTDLVSKRHLTRDDVQTLEDILIMADVGPRAAAHIIKNIETHLVDRDITAYDLKKLLASEITRILTPCARPLVIKRPEKGPFTMLVCGVNGVGKTTTIGKLAKIMHDQKHHSVMLAAGDTFRAAAVEQLQIWGARAHCPVVTRDIGADAAALAYESYDQATRDGHEVLMIDTAGRLHNKSNLMAELEKIVRVLKKHNTALPHETLLVLDGTTGQNAVAQVQTFKDMVNVTGLIVTKLDGSAKGGVVVALAHQFDLPIYAVGVGESSEDLHPFTAEGYAKALVGLG